MNAKETIVTPQFDQETINKIIIDSIQDKKAKDLVLLDLRELDEAPTDYFIICHGDSHTQVGAIADNVVAEIKKQTNQLPNHKEGGNNAHWVLVDYFNTVVHVFYHETREFYNLEDLWSDAKVTSFENID